MKRLEIVNSLEHTEISSPDCLINLVCELAGKSKNEILPRNEAGKRTEEIFGVRQAIQYLLRKKFDLSYPEIGRLTYRNHGSAIHAIKGLEDMLEMYGKHVQPIDLREHLANYLKEHPEEEPRQFPFYLQTTLEIKLPPQKTNVYYIVLNHRTVSQKELSKTITL